MLFSYGNSWLMQFSLIVVATVVVVVVFVAYFMILVCGIQFKFFVNNHIWFRKQTHTHTHTCIEMHLLQATLVFKDGKQIVNERLFGFLLKYQQKKHKIV